MDTDRIHQFHQLKVTVGQLREEKSPLAYWGQVYIRANQLLENNLTAFENAGAVERMAANYIRGYLRQVGKRTDTAYSTNVWRIAVTEARSNRISLLQHFYLSLNARTNFDLALALVETFDSEGLQNFQDDFKRVNEILGDLYEEVNDWLEEMYLKSPKMNIAGQSLNGLGLPFMPFGAMAPHFDGFIRKSLKFLEEKFADMQRNKAFQVAEKILAGSPDQRQVELRKLDRESAELSRMIARPVPPFDFLQHGLKWLEPENFEEKYCVFEEIREKQDYS